MCKNVKTVLIKHKINTFLKETKNEKKPPEPKQSKVRMDPLQGKLPSNQHKNKMNPNF